MNIWFSVLWIEKVQMLVRQRCFPNFYENSNSRFRYNGQVEMSLKGDDQVLVLFISLGVGSDAMANDVPIVCKS